MKIKTGDTVVVISGKDKYTLTQDWIEKKKIVTHKVLSADPKNGKLIVEGVNVAKKHQKARKQEDESGIIQKETPIYASKVMLFCPKCAKPVRGGYAFKDGKKYRVCKKCGAEL